MRIFTIPMITLMILLTACSHPGEGSLPDDLSYEGKYYLHAGHLTLTEPSKIRKIGVVKQATRLVKGSDIFEIERYANRNFVAAEDRNNPTGYSIYAEYAGDGKPIHFPQEISHSRVNQIQIYKDKQLINEIEGEIVQKFIQLFEQTGPNNQFIVDQPPRYHLIFLTDGSLGFMYPISDKDGEFGTPWTESKLPKDIFEYFMPRQSSG